jgi:hypothetical protein
MLSGGEEATSVVVEEPAAAAVSVVAADACSIQIQIQQQRVESAQGSRHWGQ